jgi:hypothetical protein
MAIKEFKSTKPNIPQLDNPPFVDKDIIQKKSPMKTKKIVLIRLFCAIFLRKYFNGYLSFPSVSSAVVAVIVRKQTGKNKSYLRIRSASCGA